MVKKERKQKQAKSKVDQYRCKSAMANNMSSNVTSSCTQDMINAVGQAHQILNNNSNTQHMINAVEQGHQILNNNNSTNINVCPDSYANAPLQPNMQCQAVRPPEYGQVMQGLSNNNGLYSGAQLTQPNSQPNTYLHPQQMTQLDENNSNRHLTETAQNRNNAPPWFSSMLKGLEQRLLNIEGHLENQSKRWQSV